MQNWMPGHPPERAVRYGREPGMTDNKVLGPAFLRRQGYGGASERGTTRVVSTKCQSSPAISIFGSILLGQDDPNIE